MRIHVAFFAFGVSILAPLALVGCSTMESNTLPEPSDFPIHGIDVSKYQGEIDWQAARQGGVRFAWLKATEGGDHLDDMFAVNWNAARAAGIPTGAYHFYYFCRPVEEQIAWFKSHVPPVADSLPPALDMEWVPDSKTCKTPPPNDQIRRDMRVFLREMELFYGKKPIVYTTVDFHRDVLKGEMHDQQFWVRSVAGHPTVRYGNRPWRFWQYTATGSVPGISGNVDRNIFGGSAKEWELFLAQNMQEPALTGSIVSNRP